MDYIVYNSCESTEEIKINAPYYNAIRPTEVSFVQEKVKLTVDSLGKIAFFDESGASLGFVDVAVSEDPSKYGHSAQYGQVRCASDGKEIRVILPVYWWSDNYPHCDGEGDRWDRHVDHWFTVAFDCQSKQISVLGR